MKLQPAAIVKKLFLEGKIVTVNQEVSYEDAENIAMEYAMLAEGLSILFTATIISIPAAFA